MPDAHFVIQTKPRQELRASIELARQDYDVYIPWMQVKKLRNHQMTVINEPFFPSYIFVGWAPNWWPIKSTFGVQRILMGQSDEPYKMPDSIVEQIRARINAPQPIYEPQAFQQGDRIRVTSGVLQGLEGLFHKSASQRAYALVDFSKRKVQIPLANLEAVAV